MIGSVGATRPSEMKKVASTAESWKAFARGSSKPDSFFEALNNARQASSKEGQRGVTVVDETFIALKKSVPVTPLETPLISPPKASTEMSPETSSLLLDPADFLVEDHTSLTVHLLD